MLMLLCTKNKLWMNCIYYFCVHVSAGQQNIHTYVYYTGISRYISLNVCDANRT